MSLMIELPRFRLRDFEEADRNSFVAYQMDPRYLALYDLDRDERRAGDLFNLFRGWEIASPRSNYQLGIFEQGTGRLCGCAGLRDISNDVAELGIELAPAEWGRFGLAIDATAALLRHGFEKLALSSITGTTASGNRRVEKLAHRFGARITARREGPAWMQARGWHEVDWALEREDWRRTPRRTALSSAA